MILKSFQILAICTSMAATPSNFHYDHVKKANEQVSYTYTINGRSRATNTVNNTTYTQKSQVTDNTFNNDVFFAYWETVNQTAYVTATEEVLVNKQITDFATPSQLTKIQFNPYKNLVDNKITIKDVLNVKSYNPTENIILRSYCYISQDDRWLSYIGQTNYATMNQNLNIIRDIENPQNGFIYSKSQKEQTYTITDQSGQSTKTVEFEIPVNPNKTNYIIIFSFLAAPEDGGISDGIFVYFGSSDKYGIAPTYYQPITISGKYINANISYEVVDVPNIMFEVLTMPFTFISIAFNLTLFPNTPYQINISNLFLSIIGFLVFILIIKKLTGH